MRAMVDPRVGGPGRDRFTIRLGALVAFAIFTAPGCSDDLEVDKPPAPDVSDVFAIYEAPPGRLTEETLGDVVAAAESLEALVRALGLDEVVDDLVGALDEAFEDGEASAASTPSLSSPPRETAQAEPITIEGDGFARIQRICNGWDDEPRPSEANGLVALTAGFSEVGLDGTAFGRLDRCRYVVGGSAVELATEGDDLVLSYGAPTAFSRLSSAPLLVVIDAEATVDGAMVPASLDFRVTLDTRSVLEVRVPGEGGDVVAIVDSNGVTGVRAANGDFSCDPEVGLCTAEDGTTLSF